MGLLSTLLTLPITAPLHTALWIGRKIHDHALEQMNDPAEIKRQILVLEQMLDAGEISEEEYEEAELKLLTRLRDIQRQGRAG
ncbi:MAG: gas vesicle protein GvpG [Pseudomonadota bacterium]